MTNYEIVNFGQTWKCIGDAAQGAIEQIVFYEHDELPGDLLKNLDVEDLERVLEELRCCDVPKLVQLVDGACQAAREYAIEVETA